MVRTRSPTPLPTQLLSPVLLLAADNFTAEFPVDATAEERMLLMAAVYFIDFLRFEQKQNNNNNGGNYA